MRVLGQGAEYDSTHSAVTDSGRFSASCRAAVRVTTTRKLLQLPANRPGNELSSDLGFAQHISAGDVLLTSQRDRRRRASGSFRNSKVASIDSKSSAAMSTT